MVRVENTPQGPHDVIWIILYSMITIITLAPNFGIETPTTMSYNIRGRITKLDPVMALALSGFILAAHELEWYVAFFTSTYAAQILNPWFFAGPYMMFLIILLEGAAILKPLDKQNSLVVILSIAAYNTMWAIGGFQITVNFNGLTPQNADPAVHQLENFSWIMPIFVATCLYLKEHSKKIAKNIKAIR